MRWHGLVHKLWPFLSSVHLAPEEETTIAEFSAWDEAVTHLFRYDAVSPIVKDDDSLPGSTPDLIHIEQWSNWDCGVACLEMVTVWLETDGVTEVTTDRRKSKSTTRDWMLQQARTEAIWTVDLVWILQNLQSEENHQFSFLFCSNILNVNEDLSDYNYYKDTFSEDRIRVKQRFARLFQVQPPVLFQTTPQLSLSHVVDCLQRINCVAIALVDNQILMGHVGRPYSGHYVVLAGISQDSDHLERAMQRDELSISSPASDAVPPACLVVNDPGSQETVSYFTLQHFERAWRAPGTDQDIIFVVKTTE